jgi:hypothetical protein
MPSNLRLAGRGLGFAVPMVGPVVFRAYGGRGGGWGRQLDSDASVKREDAKEELG